MSDNFKSNHAERDADLVKEIGILDLKTLITLNAGASVVLLAFLGSVARDDFTNLSVSLYHLKCSIALFIVGIIFALLSMCIVYIFSQFRLMCIRNAENFSNRYFLLWMLAPPFLSALLFLVGSIFSILAIVS